MGNEAQKFLNTNIIAMADAQATAALKLLSAKEAVTLQNELDIKLLHAKAQYAMATNWNGHFPANILPSNSPLLLNLGTSVPEDPTATKK